MLQMILLGDCEHQVDADSLSVMQQLLAPTAASLGQDFRQICQRLHDDGWRAVQLSAAMPGVRPQDLGESARRDVAATLRRLELIPAGMDLWIPRSHYLQSETIDRVIGAITAACSLARDLGIDVLSLQLPEESSLEASVMETILAAAGSSGVILADHQFDRIPPELTAAGLDPAACLAMNQDPVEVAIRLGASLIAPRLSDLLETGMRGPIGLAAGRLDVPAYRAAVTTVASHRPVVLDVR
ncbi:MAG: hypothetical protein MK089_12320, partial [Phycisphaerales bacterium]|nr:hypothetical protein [Phycisphaerales bacterium]